MRKPSWLNWNTKINIGIVISLFIAGLFIEIKSVEYIILFILLSNGLFIMKDLEEKDIKIQNLEDKIDDLHKPKTDFDFQ
jgi:hypothetical protein